MQTSVKYIGRTPRQFTDSDKRYVDENYQKQTVAFMAEHLKVHSRNIYRYMNEMGMSSLDGRKKQRAKVSDEYFNWKDFGNDILFG